MSSPRVHRPISRRRFLGGVAAAGGAAALYETMVALGLGRAASTWAGPPTFDADQGQGESVLILGAGIGGLTTAYILNQYGYRCRILEATHRAGGRNHTARRGDTIVEESSEHGRTIQVCDFDSGLYVNLGPGRLPYHHRRVLGYCQELGVALEPYVMNTTGNLFQSDQGYDGMAIPYRQVQTDARGYISELLADAVQDGALDGALPPPQREQLLGLLTTFGDLGRGEGSDPYAYGGSTRAGCGHDHSGDPTPNVGAVCRVPERGELGDLLASGYWDDGFYGPFEFEWQPTLFQPVGGMDMIVEGFLRKVGHLIEFDAPVVAIENGADSVAVTYLRGNAEVTETADHCVSNIPAVILSRIIGGADSFDAGFRDAVAGVPFASSCKVGWQANTRFWEQAPTDIYGGISWTSDLIEQIWYPSNDYFSQKGTLTGAYIHDNPGARNASLFGTFDLAKRLQVARDGAVRLHPEFADESIVPTALGISIAWQNVPHQEGAWADWGSDEDHDAIYLRLLLGDGRFHVVGDQASTLPGWQEGAMMSAEHVVEVITGRRLREDMPDHIEAPNALRVTQGLG